MIEGERPGPRGGANGWPVGPTSGLSAKPGPLALAGGTDGRVGRYEPFPTRIAPAQPHPPPPPSPPQPSPPPPPPSPQPPPPLSPPSLEPTPPSPKSPPPPEQSASLPSEPSPVMKSWPAPPPPPSEGRLPSALSPRPAGEADGALRRRSGRTAAAKITYKKTWPECMLSCDPRNDGPSTQCDPAPPWLGCLGLWPRRGDFALEGEVELLGQDGVVPGRAGGLGDRFRLVFALVDDEKRHEGCHLVSEAVLIV